MNDDKLHAGYQSDKYIDRARNAQLLADYIRTSLWDEKMNQQREYWLWEHACSPPKRSPRRSNPAG